MPQQNIGHDALLFNVFDLQTYNLVTFHSPTKEDKTIFNSFLKSFSPSLIVEMSENMVYNFREERITPIDFIFLMNKFSNSNFISEISIKQHGPLLKWKFIWIGDYLIIYDGFGKRFRNLVDAFREFFLQSYITDFEKMKSLTNNLIFSRNSINFKKMDLIKKNLFLKSFQKHGSFKDWLFIYKNKELVIYDYYGKKFLTQKKALLETKKQTGNFALKSFKNISSYIDWTITKSETERKLFPRILSTSRQNKKYKSLIPNVDFSYQKKIFFENINFFYAKEIDQLIFDSNSENLESLVNEWKNNLVTQLNQGLISSFTFNQLNSKLNKLLKSEISNFVYSEKETFHYSLHKEYYHQINKYYSFIIKYFYHKKNVLKVKKNFIQWKNFLKEQKILKFIDESSFQTYVNNCERLLSNLEIYLSGLRIIASQDENIDHQRINDFQQLKMEQNLSSYSQSNSLFFSLNIFCIALLFCLLIKKFFNKIKCHFGHNKNK